MGTTLSVLWATSFLTAVIHTIMGPDHYLPFIAIAKIRKYSLKKTRFWTFICGVGHILSALGIAMVFMYFSQWLSEENFIWIEDNRSNIAAYTLIGLGAAYLIWSVRHRWQHKHQQEHGHLMQLEANGNISVWVLFCIFFILPLIVNFGISFATTDIKAVFGVSNIIGLALMLSLMFGVMFQFPLVTYFLIRSGVTSYESVKNKRPYIFVGILIIAGILTPPDVVSQLMLTIPTYLLFEIGLYFSGKHKKG